MIDNLKSKSINVNMPGYLCFCLFESIFDALLEPLDAAMAMTQPRLKHLSGDATLSPSSSSIIIIIIKKLYRKETKMFIIVKTIILIGPTDNACLMLIVVMFG